MKKRNKNMRYRLILYDARIYARAKIARISLLTLYLLAFPLFKLITNGQQLILLFLGIVTTNYFLTLAYSRIKDERELIKAFLPNIRERHQQYLRAAHQCCHEAEVIRLKKLEEFANSDFLTKISRHSFEERLRESRRHEKKANLLLADIKLVERITANY